MQTVCCFNSVFGWDGDTDGAKVYIYIFYVKASNAKFQGEFGKFRGLFTYIKLEQFSGNIF